MITGDALFARLAVRGFSRVASDIAALQDRISAGTNDPRPSADPVRAAGLSALRDLRARIDRQASMAGAAGTRLALADQALDTLGDGVRRVQEIALQAANATLLPEAAEVLRSELGQLRAAFLATANARDTGGGPLFGGTSGPPAYAAEGGQVVYRGNAAVPVAQLGDRVLLATGVAGPQVFGADGAGLFALVDDLALALAEPRFSARDVVSAEGSARLDLPRDRGAGPARLTVTGPSGSAEVALDLRPEGRAATAAAINAVAAATGVTATVEGGALRLAAGGTIRISGYDDAGTADLPLLTPLSADGTADAAAAALRPARLSADALVARAAAAVSGVAEARGAVGLLAAAVERQGAALDTQRLTVDQAVSGLEELDVAAAVTRLQSLLATQEAAQQTYVRIAGQSLFDFLR